MNIEDLMAALPQIDVPAEIVDEHLTDLGNARRYVALHRDKVRYVPNIGWHVWTGTHWQRDEAGRALELAGAVPKALYVAALHEPEKDAREKMLAWALSSESKARLEAMVALAAVQSELVVPASALDRDPFALNVRNGTIDLRTGELRPHRQEDLITRVAPVEFDPDAKAPRWEQFLREIMAGNERLIRFLKRAVGYSLTASVQERVLFILWGSGANGKSVFLKTLLLLLGPYGKPTDPELLLVKRGEAHPTNIADLFGTRYAVTLETEQGRRMAITLVKWLTGGDKLKARFMRQDFFEFEPTFKLWIGTNHKPVVRGTDRAIWDRIRLIPFTVRFENPDEPPPGVEPGDPRYLWQDKTLPAKLAAELPGILNWAIEGCLEWQREGLGVPSEVSQATAQYREEMDTLAGFIDECCLVSPTAKVKAADLYAAYARWADTGGEYQLSRSELLKRLGERGFEVRKSTGGFYWVFGLGLLNEVNEWSGVERIPGSPPHARTRGINPQTTPLHSTSGYGKNSDDEEVEYEEDWL